LQEATNRDPLPPQGVDETSEQRLDVAAFRIGDDSEAELIRAG